MPTISNDYHRVQVWNLSPDDEQRGPYLVTQTGCAPSAEDTPESLFVLRPDGTWVDINAYLSAEQPDQLDEAVFESMATIVHLLERLPPQPTIAQLPVSEERLRLWLEQHPPGTLLETARRWLAQYRERRRPKRTPD